MSTITAANVVSTGTITAANLVSTGTITAANLLLLSSSGGGANNLVANSTTTQLQVNSANVVVANSTSTIIAVGGITELTVNTTAAVFAGTVADATATLRPLVSMTGVALTTQSTVEFTSIPSWVRRINVIFYAVSLTGTDVPLIQLGTSGGFVTTGYASYNSDAGRTSTAGFIGPGASAGDSRYGIFQISNFGTGYNSWVCTGICNSSTSNEQRTIGAVDIGGTLTQLRLTRTGTNTFDAGTVNVYYE